MSIVTLTSKAFWQRAFIAAVESGCTPIEAESRAELSLKLHDRRWPMQHEITDLASDKPREEQP